MFTTLAERLRKLKIEHSRLQHYSFSVLGVVLALLPWWLTNSRLTGEISPLFLLGALTLSAWYGGISTGLFATVLATCAYEFYLLPPFYRVVLEDSARVGQVGIFLTEGGLLSVLVGAAGICRYSAVQQQELLRNVLDSNPSVIGAKDQNGRFRLGNQALAELFGVPLEEILGKTDADFCTNSATVEQYLRDDQEVLGTRQEKFIPEESISTLSGDIRWFQTVKRPLHLDNGETLVLAIATEITQRKQMEAALQDSNRWITNVLESITDAFAAFNTQWCYTYVNQRAAEILGKPREYLIGKCLWQEFPGIIGTRFDHEYHRAVAEQITIAFEDYYQPFNTWFEIRAYPFTDGLLVYFKDVTERKQAEEKIHFQARLLATVEHAIIATDLTGAIIYWNHCAEKLFGWAATEVLGRDVLEVTPALSSEQLAAEIMAHLQTGENWSGEILLKRRDGGNFPAIVTNAPIYDTHGVLIGIVGSSTDISAQAQAQTALEQANDDLENRVQARTAELVASQALLQSILDYTPAIIYSIGTDGRIQFANAEWHRIFSSVLGNQVEGRHLTDLLPPEAAAVFFRENEELVAAGGEPMMFENDMALPDGIHTFIRVKFPLRDTKDNIYAFCSVSLDITDRKRNEEQLQALTQQLQQQNEQLAEVSRLKSEFLTGMSHELRTPLTAILGFSKVLLQQMFGPLTPKQEEYLSRIRGSGEHLLRLINDLLDLAKIEADKLELDLELVDVTELCQEAVQMIEVRASAKQQELSLELPVAVEQLVCDRQRVLQILLNYLSNAVKFTPEGGSITLSTRIACGQEWVVLIEGTRAEDQTLIPPKPGDKFLILQVNDTGIGVPKDKQHLLFQIFQQVNGADNRQFDGTGLGLALTRRLAELHRGAVAFASIPSGGSQFLVWLPLAR